MTNIHLTTFITAPIERVFDLSRSIALHKISTAHTGEKAIAGVTSGLIKLGETVTWQATHLGIRQKLTSAITAFERPYHFRDEMVKGAFKYIKHDHYFIQDNDCVIMKDVFAFASPFGILGKLADKLVLTKYLTGFLLKRNKLIKEYAETEKWKTFLNQQDL